MTPEEWLRAVAVLVRGGYFDPPETALDNEGRRTAGVSLDERAPLQIWHEVLGSTRESQTGRMRWAQAGDGRRPRSSTSLALVEAEVPVHA